jgi:ABC-type glycerol-3-phosphate transport system permease component
MTNQNSTLPATYGSPRRRWQNFLRGLPGKSVVYLLLSSWAAVSIFGFTWVVLTSFKTNQEIYSIKTLFGLPAKFQWINYVNAWTRSHMSNFFLNSVVVTIVSVLLIDLVAAMASYILGRFKFRGGRPILVGFIAGTAIPVQLILIPLYLMYLDIHLNDTLIGLILVYIAVSLPFTVLVLTGFFRSLPQELEEAAILDGASEYGVFWRIMMPLAMPGIITVSIFNFLEIWNEYMIALILIKTPVKNTIPLGLYNLKYTQQYAADWAGLFAGLVIVMIPTVLVFLLLQDRITRGMTVGALKG